MAVTGGRVSNTGIAGLTLGSGSGWLERSLGLSCDNVVSMDMVTAGGHIVTASEDENPDLFWGLRGAGGNFGIVTSIEYRLHPVGPIVLGGMLLFEQEKAGDLFAVYRALIREAPDEFGSAFAFLTAPPEEFVPEALRLQPVTGVVVCHIGDQGEGAELVDALRRQGPAVDLVEPMPYVAVQQLLDEAATFGRLGYWKVDTVDEMTDEAAATIVEHGGRMPVGESITVLEPGGRAIARVDDEATPIGHRDADYRYYAVAEWQDPEETDAHMAWAREFFAAMEPYSTSGIQVNFATDVDENRLLKIYGERKWERLVALKEEWDPENVFNLNANINPRKGFT